MDDVEEITHVVTDPVSVSGVRESLLCLWLPHVYRNELKTKRWTQRPVVLDHLDIITCLMYITSSLRFTYVGMVDKAGVCVWKCVCTDLVPHGSVSSQPITPHGHKVVVGQGGESCWHYRPVQRDGAGDVGWQWTEQSLCLPQLSLGKLWAIPSLPVFPGREASLRTGAAQCHSGSSL